MEEQVRRAKIELPETEGWEEINEDYYITIPWLYTDKTVDRGYAAGDELSIAYSLRAKRGFQLWRWYIKLDNDIDLKLSSGYSYRKLIKEDYIPVDGFDPYEPANGTATGVHTVVKTTNGEEKTSYEPELKK